LERTLLRKRYTVEAQTLWTILKAKTMGHWKEIAIEMQQEEWDRHLADFLGITYDELNELDYELETVETNDGFVYKYVVKFNPNNSPKNILQKIKNLEDGCRVYLEPWDLEQYYDYEKQYDAITENQDYLKKCKEELNSLKSLNELAVSDKRLKEILTRQLYIGVISTMETFLSEAFINLVNHNDEFFRNFIKTHPEFKKRKFELSEIFDQYDKLQETAKVVMLDTIYHNLPSVSQIFRNTFKKDFPPIKHVYECVLKRHDLVHRNGRTKDGKPVELNENMVNELIEEVSKFVEEIASKLNIN
jgi:hypothetical protein